MGLIKLKTGSELEAMRVAGRLTGEVLSEIGKFLMNVVLGHPDVRPRSCMLTTKDAHTMYEAFGFARFEAMKRQGGQA